MGDLVDFDGGRSRDRLRNRPGSQIAAWSWCVAAGLGIVLFALFTAWCECGPMK